MFPTFLSFLYLLTLSKPKPDFNYLFHRVLIPTRLTQIAALGYLLTLLHVCLDPNPSPI